VGGAKRRPDPRFRRRLTLPHGLSQPESAPQTRMVEPSCASRAPVRSDILNDSEQLRERMAELGRISGERRRERAAQRRARDAGVIVWDVFNADPEGITRSVFASGNAMAKVKLIEYATEAKTAELKRRELAVEERESEVERREFALHLRELSLDDAEELTERTHSELEAVRQEIASLEAVSDELRALVSIGAAAAGYELEEVPDVEA
jgi:hypothetical protein